MPKYKVSVQWSGNNETIEEFDNEEEAINYGYEDLADGCGEAHVSVELIEEDNEEDNEEDGSDE